MPHSFPPRRSSIRLQERCQESPAAARDGAFSVCLHHFLRRMDTTHTKATTIAATAARMIRCQRLMPNTDSPFVGLRHAAYSRDSSTVIFIRLRSALSIPSASSLPATCRSEEHTSELQSL